MAVTKIKQVKVAVYNVIQYITDPGKTDGTLLASGYNCEPTTAHYDFRMTAALAKKLQGDRTKTGGGNNLAYHLIQSFAKTDKISPEKAHEIGKQLADGVFKDKHEYVIATHIDKGHIHNHIVANAVSFRDYTKFRTRPYETARRIREISDKLCRENGLHVIEGGRRQWGKDKQKWQYNITWRDKLRVIIDRTIYHAVDYSQFVDLLQAAGVEIKGIEATERKHMAFRLTSQGQERFTRGDKIGALYTREKIKARIVARDKKPPLDIIPQTPLEKRVVFMSTEETIAKIRELGNAIVFSRQEKVNVFTDFDRRIKELKLQCKNVRQDIRELEQKNRHYRDIAKCLITCQNYLPIANEYERMSGSQKQKYFTAHESEIRVFNHAKEQLIKEKISLDQNTEEIIKTVESHMREADSLTESFREIEDRIANLERSRQIIAEIIRPEDARIEDRENKTRQEEKVR